MANEEKGEMSVSEAGRRGGAKTAETHGHEFYEEIGHSACTNQEEKESGGPSGVPDVPAYVGIIDDPRITLCGPALGRGCNRSRR